MPASSPTKTAHPQELRWRKHAYLPPVCYSVSVQSFLPIAFLAKQSAYSDHAEHFEPVGNLLHRRPLRILCYPFWTDRRKSITRANLLRDTILRGQAQAR